MIEVEKEDDNGKREHAGPWGGPLIEEGGVGTSRTWERHLAMASVPAGSWLPSKGWEWPLHWLFLMPGVSLTQSSARLATLSFREQLKIHLCWDSYGCLQSALWILPQLSTLEGWPMWTGFKTVQQVPYIQTFKLWTFKDVNTHSHVQSHMLVHVSGVHGHVRASYTSGCAFVYFTVQYCLEYSSTVSLFLACSLNASPYMLAIVLYYCTFQGTVL